MKNKVKFITFEGGEGSGKSTQSKMLYEYLLSKNIKAILTREIGGTPAAEKVREIIIHNELLNKSELMLVMGARYEHINKVIIPALLDGSWVICDRFVDSSACYQSIGSSDLSIDDIYKLHQELMAVSIKDLTNLGIKHSENSNVITSNAWQSSFLQCFSWIASKLKLFAMTGFGNKKTPQGAAEICLMPDSTFFIDVSPEIGLKRTIARGDNNKFENKQLEFHQQIYDRFKLIAKQHPSRIITIPGEDDTATEIHRQIISKISL